MTKLKFSFKLKKAGYVYDPDHKITQLPKPTAGGKWRKTQKGWSDITLEEEKNEGQINEERFHSLAQSKITRLKSKLNNIDDFIEKDIEIPNDVLSSWMGEEIKGGGNSFKMNKDGSIELTLTGDALDFYNKKTENINSIEDKGNACFENLIKSLYNDFKINYQAVDAEKDAEKELVSVTFDETQDGGQITKDKNNKPINKKPETIENKEEKELPKTNVSEEKKIKKPKKEKVVKTPEPEKKETTTEKPIVETVEQNKNLSEEKPIEKPVTAPVVENNEKSKIPEKVEPLDLEFKSIPEREKNNREIYSCNGSILKLYGKARGNLERIKKHIEPLFKVGKGFDLEISYLEGNDKKFYPVGHIDGGEFSTDRGKMKMPNFVDTFSNSKITGISFDSEKKKSFNNCSLNNVGFLNDMKKIPTSEYTTFNKCSINDSDLNNVVLTAQNTAVNSFVNNGIIAGAKLENTGYNPEKTKNFLHKDLQGKNVWNQLDKADEKDNKIFNSFFEKTEMPQRGVVDNIKNGRITPESLVIYNASVEDDIPYYEKEAAEERVGASGADGEFIGNFNKYLEKALEKYKNLMPPDLRAKFETRNKTKQLLSVLTMMKKSKKG